MIISHTEQPQVGPTHFLNNALKLFKVRAPFISWGNVYIEYPSRECKHDIQDSEGNLFHPIFKENVQGQKHPGSCTFAEPELLSYKKLKRVAQDEKNGHKNPQNSHNYYDENHDVIKLYQGNSKRST